MMIDSVMNANDGDRKVISYFSFISGVAKRKEARSSSSNVERAPMRQWVLENYAQTHRLCMDLDTRIHCQLD